MKRLIFIHGRSQQNLDPTGLKKEWRDALDTGLTSIGVSLPDCESICFPYYGDALHQLDEGSPQSSVAPVIIRSATTETVPPEEQRLLGEILIAAASRPEIAEQLTSEGLHPSAINRDVQNWPVVLRLAQALAHIPGIDVDTIALATHDVYIYLSQPEITSFIDRGVESAFKPDLDTVVVSHSLGTIVAYHILRGFDCRYRITHLITLGSPLGIPTVQRMLGRFTRPLCVANWSNARDPKDIVALYPLTPPTFNLANVTEKSDVANFTPNHHSIPGYLQDETAARWIYNALL